MSIRNLNRESVRIGENLRVAVLRARAKYPGLTNRSIAESAGIHPVTLSRILSGYPASSEVIERISSAIGANPDKIINKGKRKTLYSARSLEDIINDDSIISQFVGGGDRIAIDWVRKQLRNILIQCSKRRAELSRTVY